MELYRSETQVTRSPNNPVNEERFQWLAAAIRKYEGDASIVQLRCRKVVDRLHVND